MKVTAYIIIFIVALLSLNVVLADNSANCTTTNQKNFVILIDVSGSVTGSLKSNSPTALDTYEEYAEMLVNTLPYNSNTGIVIFAASAKVIMPLVELNQNSKPDFINVIQHIKNEVSTVGQHTKVAIGINSAIAMLSGIEGSSEIFLFSDGANQDRNYAIESAKLASTKGIKISPFLVARVSDFSGESADWQNMQSYADISDGTFGTNINLWLDEVKKRAFETKPLCKDIIIEANVTNTTKLVNIAPDSITLEVNAVLAKYNASQNVSSQLLELPPESLFMQGSTGKAVIMILGLILIASSIIMYRRVHHKPVN